MNMRRHKKARFVQAICDPSTSNGYDNSVTLRYVRRWRWRGVSL